jgi:hypothetical protein
MGNSWWRRGSCGRFPDTTGPGVADVVDVADVDDNVDGPSMMMLVAADVCLYSNLDLRLLLQHLQASAAQPADDYRSSCRLG